jgi:hypothetical protein
MGWKKDQFAFFCIFTPCLNCCNYHIVEMKMGQLKKTALADAALTCFFVAVTASFGEVGAQGNHLRSKPPLSTAADRRRHPPPFTLECLQLGVLIGPFVGLQPSGAALGLTLLLLIALVPVCAYLGGALCNPQNNAFLFATGHGSGKEHVVRSLAQAAGGMVGAWLAIELLPGSWSRWGVGRESKAYMCTSPLAYLPANILCLFVSVCMY